MPISEDGRDPARIDPILDRLRAAWHASPDLRLTQLVWALGAEADSGESAPRFFYREDDALHWERVAAHAEQGTCDLCGQELIRTADDCWHPVHVERNCPPVEVVDSIQRPMFGDGFGRPGREHFVSSGVGDR